MPIGTRAALVSSAVPVTQVALPMKIVSTLDSGPETDRNSFYIQLLDARWEPSYSRPHPRTVYLRATRSVWEI